MTDPNTPRGAVIAGAFDDLQSSDVRLLEEASRFGPLTVRLFDDAMAARLKPVKFPLAERRYTLESIRYVGRVEVLEGVPLSDVEAIHGPEPRDIACTDPTPELLHLTRRRGVTLRVVDRTSLDRYPAPAPCPDNPRSDRRKIIATGCFDWLHSGHVRFFEEVSELGDLYVVVGHDANIRLLKGEGKPMFSQDQRCYSVGAIRFVKQAMVSSGHGWLDAEPEAHRLKPDAYAVNEDGDVPEKRAFCERMGIDYIVLKRLPKEGLQRRSSTALRGF